MVCSMPIAAGCLGRSFPICQSICAGVVLDTMSLANAIARLPAIPSILMVNNAPPTINILNLTIHFLCRLINSSTLIVNKLLLATIMTLPSSIILVLMVDFSTPSTDKSIRAIVISPMHIDKIKNATNNFFCAMNKSLRTVNKSLRTMNKFIKTTNNFFRIVGNSKRYVAFLV